LWLDPDVRWLTGVHEAGGHAYLVREAYEELLWWLLMPSLLRMGSDDKPSRAAVEEMRKSVEKALATAEAASYRIDALLGPVPQTPDVEPAEAEIDSEETDPKDNEPKEVDLQAIERELPPIEPDEPPHEKLVGKIP
jgi:hypothetical protein